MNPRLEDDLRRMLENRAAAVPHSPDPYRTTRHQIARAKRRRKTALLTAGLCLALTAAVPVQRFVLRLHQDPLLNANGKPFPVLDWPARGSLAHDREYQDALCDRMRTRPGRAGPFAGTVCRVLYAHDDGTRQLAILAYQIKDNDAATVLVCLYGPIGDGVVQLKGGYGVLSTKRQEPIIASIEEPGGTTAHVVLGPPAVRTVEISSREEPLADGTVRREWRSFPAPEGAARASGLWTPGRQSMRVRLISDGGSAEYPAQDPIGGATRYDPGPIPNPLASDPLVNKVEFRKAVFDVAMRYAVQATALRTRVLWAGSTDGYGTVVLAVNLPSGGAVQAAHHYGRLVGNRTRIRVVPTADAATKPVGWSHVTEQPVPGRTGEVATGVYAASYRGLRVEVLDGSRIVTTGLVRNDGLALMPWFRTAEVGISTRLTYRIVDPAGKIAHEDRLGF